MHALVHISQDPDAVDRDDGPAALSHAVDGDDVSPNRTRDQPAMTRPPAAAAAECRSGFYIVHRTYTHVLCIECYVRTCSRCKRADGARWWQWGRSVCGGGSSSVDQDVHITLTMRPSIFLVSLRFCDTSSFVAKRARACQSHRIFVLMSADGMACVARTFNRSLAWRLLHTCL